MGICHRFGKKVRELRRRAGITQEMLGEAVGLSPVAISNIERGVNAPRFKRIGAFAEALNVEVAELFRFHDGPPDTDEA